ncbi:MAG: hypothetical protein MN733_07965 [Nitrososphaera sp.]|nr:hypothetical protein [Nitrososphaera sp.]MCI0648283.1 hypothetical protein [Chloroflexota bacterium]
MKLYSYCLRYDDGAAPNPFWGICTLVICKPKIRGTAKVGDWVVGLGSTNSPIGDISDHVVYAMKVTKKVTMQEYDRLCQEQYPKKIPNWRSKDYRRRVGDCIYDYTSGSPPKIRWSVHDERNRRRDLSGRYALLSTYFYYFGNKPVQLDESLQFIIHSTQGHKSAANQPYVEEFVLWMQSLGYKPNKLYGEPQLKSEFAFDSDIRGKCASRDLEDDEEGLSVLQHNA